MQRNLVIAITIALFIGLLFLAWNIREAYYLIPANVMKPLPLSPYSMWREYTSPHGHYSIKFPIYPQHAEDVVHTQAKESRQYDMNVAELGNGTTYMVTRITFSSDSGQPTLQGLPEYQKEVVDSSPNSLLESEQKATFFGHEALDFVMATETTTTSYRLFFVDDTLYILMVTSKLDLYSPSDVHYFFDSLRLM